MENLVKQFIEAVDAANTIYISSHVSVDGDNIGSILAMYQVLKKLNKDVYVLKSDVIPKTYAFLPDVDKIIEPNCDLKDADLYIALDSADKKRLGENALFFDAAKNRVVIDHHETNVGFGDINVIDPKISSTCELLANIFLAAGYEFTPEIATCLFNGISSDTGRFLYTNVSIQTMEIAKFLMENGADTKTINTHLYQSRSIENLNAIKLGLSNMHIEEYVSYSTISLKEMSEYNLIESDLDEIINYIRDIEGIMVAFVIKEKETNFYKVSMRSKKTFDVSKIASHFDGGGHINAAGFSYTGNIKDLISEIMGLIKDAR
ncbi:MAG: bifunctional oligoribonuclease/PAP phosphatase NrnA [Ezakiella sp.]|nr:bifunctional oligoribonuclease/PAP phosphatase NrnA [Ezakiella sp.]MDD7471960.1 bifunctional oligoribonuclease/PAP phosphatase NrnA [Bacillota bacterium]MDY3923924.1 bifunctional oligoribonuclease/PAP phosphatase NrnA [Ezakiella sp.]